MDVLFLSERQVRELLDLNALLDGLQAGFGQLTEGDVNAPGRNEVARPHESFLLGMPGHREGTDMTVKVVTVFERNLERGLPSHLAIIARFDPDTGACTAFMDGTYITAVRTSASAAVSTRLLARPDAGTLTIIGAGVQGEHHLATFPLVRDFDTIHIASLHFEDAERLARRHPAATAVRDVERAVRESDVVALATHAGAPVIEPAWVRPGTHVSSVGYRPPDGELPRRLAREHSLFVETREATFEPTPVGCAELQGLDPAHSTELGEVVLGRRPGRRRDDEITVYKAMGHVIEDIVAADLAYAAAVEAGAGTSLSL